MAPVGAVAGCCLLPARATIGSEEATTGQVLSTYPLLDRDHIWRGYLCRVGIGDHSAFEALFKETSPLVFAIALKILGFHADAEEVTGDVYARLWRIAASYDGVRGSVVTWLRVITRNLSFDHLRSVAAKARCEVTLAYDYSSASDLESDIMAGQARGHMLAALQALPPEQRQAIELAYYLGLTYPEIATRLGDPLGTVKTRIRSGLLKLRRLLEAAS